MRDARRRDDVAVAVRGDGLHGRRADVDADRGLDRDVELLPSEYLTAVSGRVRSLCRRTTRASWVQRLETRRSSTGTLPSRRCPRSSCAICNSSDCASSSARCCTARRACSGASCVHAGIESPLDLRSPDDVNLIPTTVKQDLRDSEAEHPPFGEYRFTRRQDCVRLGSSTGTTGTPTLTLWTRHDIWLEYESAARVWWRNGWRPGQIVTHAHPAYLYGGGVMLSGCARVLRHAQHLGRAARHRRARRAGHPHVGARASRRVDGRVQLWPFRRGRGEDGQGPHEGRGPAVVRRCAASARRACRS